MFLVIAGTAAAVALLALVVVVPLIIIAEIVEKNPLVGIILIAVVGSVVLATIGPRIL
ncbi:hypothetical protein IVB22_10730 [Bradyrhizobium sp. 190]|uniref:hypothetical protein n=1 Tax=Bradyrhizobium sp. 190 TaxID=2782658 RepID=UPI001FFA04E7|nr:hypothetical protein [Bradyrhizobium sp. 190]MCK1513039.1 hypothetical protein [Bradyrhizobium sp. 190]